MKLWKMAFAGLALSMALGVTACGSDSAQKSGNNENCTEGTCTNNCDSNEKSCNMNCSGSSHCKATCQDGQSCSFSCGGTATCEFDCTKGSCNTSGDSDNCTCTGTCMGTCGGITGGGGSSGGGDCSKCGKPTDPGYAQCMQDCN